MGLKVFLNGEFVESEEAKISIFDHGILYGDGVFEGIRAYNRSVFRPAEHLDRLYDGAGAIRLEIGMSKNELQEKIMETLRLNDLDNAYIRVVVTRGIGDLGLDPRKCRKPSVFIIADRVALYPREYYISGLPIVTAKTRRNPPEALDPRVKSLNYMNNILGKIDAIDAGTEEALMLSMDGYVAECTGDNIFVVTGGRLVTPPDDVGALYGITQKAVIELARKEGFDFAYATLKLEQLYEADECFLTGTAAEIIPVVKIDGKVIGTGKPGEVTRKLMGFFRELVERDGVKY